MSLLYFASVLVSLLSFSTAAPTTDECRQLTQPLTLNELPKILGRWILIEGFANNELFNLILENLESMWMMVSTTADNNTLLLDMVNPSPKGPGPKTDECLRIAQNVTLTDDKALEFHLKVAAMYYKFLQTCPDCLVMHMYTKVNEYQALYLSGRNKTVAASDLETFRKQAECLQFPQPARFHYDANIELCPEDTPTRTIHGRTKAPN